MRERARAPRCEVRLNDTGAILPADVALLFPDSLLDGVIEAEVVNTNYQSADTFRLVVALALAPPWFTLDFLGTASYIPVTIRLGPNPDDMLTVMQGLVDDFSLDPVQNTVELRGRDYTRYFIDASSTETWPNHTASQIARALARRHGLGVENIADTTTPVGGKGSNAQAKLGDGRTEWDLLCALANMTVAKDGSSFVVFVQGSQLVFGPRPVEMDYGLSCVPAAPGQPFSILPASDPAKGPAWGGLSLNLSRNISVLRQVAVELFSAQGNDRRSLRARYPVKAVSGEQLYQLRVAPNQTLAALQQRARAMQQDTSRHELRLEFSLPGDSVLGQSSLLQLSGLGGGFDQSYFVQSVTRRFSLSDGYVMEGTAQNRVTGQD